MFKREPNSTTEQFVAQMTSETNNFFIVSSKINTEDETLKSAFNTNSFFSQIGRHINEI